MVLVYSVDCALKLQEGLADFGVFTAEQAILASHFIDESVNVIADLRHSERSNGILINFFLELPFSSGFVITFLRYILAETVVCTHDLQICKIYFTMDWFTPN